MEYISMMKTNIFKIVNKKIHFTPDEYTKCADFSCAVTPTTSKHVSERGQSDVSKQTSDHLISKLGEICTYKYLNENSAAPLCTYPDFTVKEFGKSFDADIKLLNGQNVHVKSQTIDSERSFGSSWMFQYADYRGNKSGHYDKEIFDNPESTDLCVFCTVYSVESYVIIRAVVSLNLLHKHELFDMPVKSSLRISKKSVYYASLGKIYSEQYKPKDENLLQ